MVSRAARAGAGSASALPHPLHPYAHPYAPSLHCTPPAYPRCIPAAPPCILAASPLRPHCIPAASSLHLCRRGAVQSPRASAARSYTRYRGAPSLTRTRTSTPNPTLIPNLTPNPTPTPTPNPYPLPKPCPCPCPGAPSSASRMPSRGRTRCASCARRSTRRVRPDKVVRVRVRDRVRVRVRVRCACVLGTVLPTFQTLCSQPHPVHRRRRAEHPARVCAHLPRCVRRALAQGQALVPRLHARLPAGRALR